MEIGAIRVGQVAWRTRAFLPKWSGPPTWTRYLPNEAAGPEGTIKSVGPRPSEGSGWWAPAIPPDENERGPRLVLGGLAQRVIGICLERATGLPD